MIRHRPAYPFRAVGWVRGFLLALAVLAVLSCSTLRLEPRSGAVERIEVKCSAPSHLRYWLDAELVFERVSQQALPPNVKCRPPVVEFDP